MPATKLRDPSAAHGHKRHVLSRTWALPAERLRTEHFYSSPGKPKPLKSTATPVPNSKCKQTFGVRKAVGFSLTSTTLGSFVQAAASAAHVQLEFGKCAASDQVWLLHTTLRYLSILTTIKGINSKSGTQTKGRRERERERWLNGRASAVFAGVPGSVPAGAFAIFSVPTKASLPISLSPFPSSSFPFPSPFDPSLFSA